jgi:hypothetical protein
VIDNVPRRVVIIDRVGLEAASCECYTVDKGLFTV